jgi:hypothetical protein
MQKRLEKVRSNKEKEWSGEEWPKIRSTVVAKTWSDSYPF